MAIVDTLKSFMYTSLWGRPVIGTLRGLGQLIKSIFRNNEQGFAYDINDLSTLYQDAAGTTPVTAAGQPVGLVLDKSRGLVLGQELVSNGDFSQSLTGWATASSFASTAIIDNGELIVTASVASGRQVYPVNCEVGKAYLLTGYCRLISGTGSAIIAVSETSYGGAIYTVTSNNSSTAIKTRSQFTATATRMYVVAGSAGGTGVTAFDNISVKELPGNHAYQTTSASRPLLQRNATTGAYYLAFDGTDDFLVTSSIDFTATDKISLFAGVRKLSDATFSIITEISASLNTNNGTFYLAVPAASGTYEFATKGTVARTATKTGIIAPHSAVLTAQGNIGLDITKLNVNGISTLSNVDLGTGNYGNYPLYIGRRGGTNAPFNGHLYSLICVARLSTDAETTNLEKAIAKNVGVAL